MRKTRKKEVKKKLLKHGFAQALSPESKEFQEQEKLWRAVIDRAFADIIEPNNLTDYIEALEWFDIQNKDFVEVCENASLHPSYVLKMKQLLLITSDKDLI